MYINRDGTKIIELIPKRCIFRIEPKPDMHHFFFFFKNKIPILRICNLKFRIRPAFNSKAKVFIQIWLPLIHIMNHNGELCIGNKYKLVWFHH